MGKEGGRLGRRNRESNGGLVLLDWMEGKKGREEERREKKKKSLHQHSIILTREEEEGYIRPKPRGAVDDDDDDDDGNGSGVVLPYHNPPPSHKLPPSYNHHQPTITSVSSFRADVCVCGCWLANTPPSHFGVLWGPVLEPGDTHHTHKGYSNRIMNRIRELLRILYFPSVKKKNQLQ